MIGSVRLVSSRSSNKLIYFFSVATFFCSVDSDGQKLALGIFRTTRFYVHDEETVRSRSA
jgi:hypothetical protein